MVNGDGALTLPKSDFELERFDLFRIALPPMLTCEIQGAVLATRGCTMTRYQYGMIKQFTLIRIKDDTSPRRRRTFHLPHKEITNASHTIIR